MFLLSLVQNLKGSQEIVFRMILVQELHTILVINKTNVGSWY
jgi:hypothetical protein